MRNCYFYPTEDLDSDNAPQRISQLKTLPYKYFLFYHFVTFNVWIFSWARLVSKYWFRCSQNFGFNPIYVIGIWEISAQKNQECGK